MHIHILRVIITASVIYFAYPETGPITTVIFVLMAVAIETITYWMRKQQQLISQIMKIKRKL